MICSAAIIAFHGNCHHIGKCQGEGGKWQQSLGSDPFTERSNYELKASLSPSDTEE